MRQRSAAAARARIAPAAFLIPLVWIALHLYAGRPLLIAAATRGIAPALAYGGVVALSLCSLLPFFVRGGVPGVLRTSASWLGYAMMSLFSLLLVFAVVSDLLRAGWLAASVIARQAHGIGWPALDLPAMAAVILTAATVLSLVGLVQARMPSVRRVDIPIAGLADALEGYRIVQLSDVHISATIQAGFIEKLVARTNALEPDAVVITGDLVDGRLADLEGAAAPLAELRAGDGVFFVTGNHEYYWDAAEWIDHLRRLGLTVLINEHRVVERGGARLAIAGITDPVGSGAHQQDLGRALRGIPADAVSVLLSHRPQGAEEAARRGVHLQLSGHTHGGQFFPFNLLVGFFQPVVRGLHRFGALHLYVSRGTGYWGPPSRLGVGGEITVLELVRERG